MQGFWVHLRQRKGVSLSPGLCLLGAQALWGARLPTLHSVLQMQVIHCSLPWEMMSVQGLSHHLTDKETEACGDGVFPQ